MSLLTSFKREFASRPKVGSSISILLGVASGAVMSSSLLQAADVFSSRSVSGFLVSGMTVWCSMAICLFLARVWEGRNATDSHDGNAHN